VLGWAVEVRVWPLEEMRRTAAVVVWVWPLEVKTTVAEEVRAVVWGAALDWVVEEPEAADAADGVDVAPWAEVEEVVSVVGELGAAVVGVVVGAVVVWSFVGDGEGEGDGESVVEGAVVVGVVVSVGLVVVLGSTVDDGPSIVVDCSVLAVDATEVALLAVAPVPSACRLSKMPLLSLLPPVAEATAKRRERAMVNGVECMAVEECLDDQSVGLRGLCLPPSGQKLLSQAIRCRKGVVKTVNQM